MSNEPSPARQPLRAGERFHHLHLPAGAWCVVRVDGRGFGRLAREPAVLADAVLAAARALLNGMQSPFVYTWGDEASVLIPPRWNLFGRNFEKTISLAAGMASAECSLVLGQAVQFDSRVWVAEVPAHVYNYFEWRRAVGSGAAGLTPIGTSLDWQRLPHHGYDPHTRTETCTYRRQLRVTAAPTAAQLAEGIRSILETQNTAREAADGT